MHSTLCNILDYTWIKRLYSLRLLRAHKVHIAECVPVASARHLQRNGRDPQAGHRELLLDSAAERMLQVAGTTGEAHGPDGGSAASDLRLGALAAPLLS